MKGKLLTILFLFFIILIVDYKLSFYGKNYGLLSVQLPYDFNTDFNELEGFKIEEEGFIQIIGKGTSMDNNVIISDIIEYAHDSFGIYCKIRDVNQHLYVVSVVYDENRHMGDKILFSIVNVNKLSKELNWITVLNNSGTQLLETFRITLLILFLLPLFSLVRNSFK